MVTYIRFYICLFKYFSPVANFGYQSLCDEFIGFFFILWRLHLMCQLDNMTFALYKNVFLYFFICMPIKFFWSVHLFHLKNNIRDLNSSHAQCTYYLHWLWIKFGQEWKDRAMSFFFSKDYYIKKSRIVRNAMASELLAAAHNERK